jgi:hypothetical protein
MTDDKASSERKLNQRRRAVHGALRGLFGERQSVIGVAFRLWEREFANQPHFIVTRFVSRCADTIGMTDAERIALTRRTFELMTKPYEALERYPEGLLTGSDEPAPAAPPPTTQPTVMATGAPLSFVSAGPLPASAVVAGAVGRALLAPVRAQARSQAGMLAEIIGDAARHAKLPQDLRDRLENWCSNGGADDAMLGGLDVVMLRQWVHVLYLAACDANGPVAADRLLAQSIARAASLPAAVEFAPDQLL